MGCVRLHYEGSTFGVATTHDGLDQPVHTHECAQYAPLDDDGWQYVILGKCQYVRTFNGERAQFIEGFLPLSTKFLDEEGHETLLGGTPALDLGHLLKY